MFTLLSKSALSEVVAPAASPVEEFFFQWNSFTSFFTISKNDNSVNKRHVESTDLPTRLLKMANIVITEQIVYNKRNNSALCPCMEYLLSYKILETLSSIGQADSPLGICPHIMLFMIRLVKDSETILIPHKSVHSSLNKLIVLCGKIQASPYENIEMYFLAELVDIIIRNPDFLNFFLDFDFPLINALLSLLHTADSEITKQAGDCIIQIMSIINDRADHIIVERTPFCCKILNQLSERYTDIPKSRPQDLESAIKIIDFQQVDLTNSLRKYFCFLKWFKFIDMLIYHSPKNSSTVESLLANFKSDFLESILLPDLRSDGFMNELEAFENIFLSTLLISSCLRNAESIILFDFICYFLIIPDEKSDLKMIKHKNYDLYKILIRRCDLKNTFSTNDEEKFKFLKIASITLQLLEDILSKPSFKVLEALILKHISQVQYSCKTLENPNVYSQIVAPKFNSLKVLEKMKKVADEIEVFPNVLEASNINDLQNLYHHLYYFVSLMPNELKVNVQNEISNYVAYLKEAVEGFHFFINKCYSNWCQNGRNINILAETGEFNHNKQEENFIQVLLNNLESIFKFPYDIKLQILSLLAKISLIPEESINRFFLDPTATHESQTLFDILHKLISDLQISVKGIAQLSQRLEMTKKVLLGENEANRNNFNNESEVLQNLILLDEFCKELACIIYVKNYILKLVKNKKS